MAELNVEDGMKRAWFVVLGKRKLLVFLYSVFMAPVFAGNYFVAPAGNNSNIGSPQSPWATLGHAVTKAQPGDTIFVRGGIYSEGEIWIRREYGMGGRDGKYVTITAYPGETPIFTNGSRGLIVDASYVRVSGLDFRNGKTLYNVDWAGPTDHVEFSRNRFSGSPDYAAIDITGDFNLVEGNIIEIAGNTVGTQGHGIYAMRGKNTVIRGNTISGATGYGIHLYEERRSGDPAGYIREIKNIVIENNFVFNSRERAGIIVGAGADSGPAHIDGVIIRHNVVIDNSSCGIVVNGWSEIENIQIYNNTIHGNGDNGIQIFQKVKNVIIKNNIVCVKSGRRHIDNAPNAPGVVVERNLYCPAAPALRHAQDSRPVNGDPLFADPARKDFHLRQGSMAIDAGVNTGSAFTGAAPDLGAFEFDGAAEIRTGSLEIPASFALEQNYPNPFNPETDINFGLPTEAFVNLAIFDLLGRRVKTLVRGWLTPGWKVVKWNARNEAGARVSSGIYLYRLAAGNFTAARRMVVLK